MGLRALVFFFAHQNCGLAANALGARVGGRACIWDSGRETETQGTVALGTHRDTYGPSTFIVRRNAETIGNCLWGLRAKGNIDWGHMVFWPCHQKRTGLSYDE